MDTLAEPVNELLVRAVQTLAGVCDGALSQDGVGYNGPDSTFGHALASTPAEAWSQENAYEAWEMLAKYRGQLSSVGIDYDAIPTPSANRGSKGIRAVDVRNGKVLVFLPYGDSSYPKYDLNATWFKPEKGWLVPVGSYGKVVKWAEQNGLSISNRAKSLLAEAPQSKNDYIGAAVVRGSDIVLRFEYRPKIVDAVRAIPGRKWNDADKTWLVPLGCAVFVRKLAEDFGFQLSQDVMNLPVSDELSFSKPRISVNGKTFALSFPYDAQLLTQVRAMPGAVWSPQLRVWVVPIESVEEVLAFAKEHDAVMSEEAHKLVEEAGQVQQVIEASAAHDAEITINGFGTPTYQLFPFQRAGVAYALRQMGFVQQPDGEWKQETAKSEGVIIGDEMGLGKGHPHGTQILTPKGWANIENLSVGDQVIGSDGHATMVKGVFPRGVLPTFRVTMNDGSSVVVDGDHIWAVQSVQNGHRNPDQWLVKETRDLATQLIDGAGNRKWKIPMVKPVHFEGDDNLPLDPYFLGLLIGDGGLTSNSIIYTTADQELLNYVRSVLPQGMRITPKSVYDYALVGEGAGKPNELLATLRSLGVMGHGSHTKFVPQTYLFASPEARLEILRGLMDTDGSAGLDGTNEFVSASKQLADDVAFIVQSLGGVVRRSIKTVDGGAYYRVNVKLGVCPFRLSRKVDAWKAPTKYPPNRSIASIEPAGDAEVICIAVEAQDQLYVTEHCIVTHNTPQGLAVLKATNAFPAVVVVPASLKLNWKREAERWIPGVNVKVLSGTSGNLPDADIWVINYDILSHWVNKFGNIRGLVLDESHYIKNGSAQRSKSCVALTEKVVEGGVRICLSGTAVVNQPLELMTQLRVVKRLDEFGGASGFRREYGTSRPRTLASLNRKLRASCYVRRRKADVLKELPPKRWATIAVEGDPAVMKEYRKAEADIVKYLTQLAQQLALESGAVTEEAQNEAWRRALAARAAEHLVSISVLKQLAAKAKMKAAKEWIGDFLDTDKKLVVFGWHREVVDFVSDEFSNGAKIQGGMTAERRQEFVDAFQDTDEQKVISCQIKAAGVGLTLTAASDVLFIEQGWTPSDMEQAVDRCHRIGQQDSVTGWVMLTADTIDEYIADIIERKRSVVDRVIDGSEDDEAEEQSVVGQLLVALAERGLRAS